MLSHGVIVTLWTATNFYPQRLSPHDAETQLTAHWRWRESLVSFGEERTDGCESSPCHQTQTKPVFLSFCLSRRVLSGLVVFSGKELFSTPERHTEAGFDHGKMGREKSSSQTVAVWFLKAECSSTVVASLTISEPEMSSRNVTWVKRTWLES